MRTRRRLLSALVLVFASSTGPGGAQPYEFADRAADAWLDQTTVTWGSFWTDYDGDGRADAFLGRHRMNGWLLRDGGTHFVRQDVPALRAFFDRHGCAWGEATGDGRPDLACTQGADRGEGAGPNQLLVQTNTGGFEDRADDYAVTDSLGRGRTVNWLDYDGDGDLDLFVGNTLRAGAPNALFRNDRGTFVRASSGIAESLETHSTSWSDWDRDGDPDLLILTTDGVVTYRNEAGDFTRATLSGVPQRAWEAAAWGDYDGDGWTDLHLLAKRSSLILHNDGGAFTEASLTRARHGRASAWFDVNNDGDLDLFVVQGGGPNDDVPNRPDVMFVNSQGTFERRSNPSFAGPSGGSGDSVAALDYERDADTDLFVTNGRWDRPGPSSLFVNPGFGGRGIGLDLRGSRWNPFGFGARIRVEADTLVYWREVTDATGARAQSEVGYVALGIGWAESAHVQIMWPDGRRDCMTVPAGEVALVDIGASSC